jgi:hypothetical protein
MSQVTQELALQILNSRILVGSPTKITCKCTSSNDYFGREGVKAIANFNVTTPFHMEKAKVAFMDGDYDGAINGTSLSASIRTNDYMPAKGELVDLEIGEYTTKDGDTALGIMNIIPRKAKVMPKVDFGAFLSTGVSVEADSTSMD